MENQTRTTNTPLTSVEYTEPDLTQAPAPTLENTDGQLPIKNWKNVGRIIELKLFDDTTIVTTGDNKLVFCIPASLDGAVLQDAQAFVSTVSSSGTPTVQLRNVTNSADMLSTVITIDINEKTSYTATTPRVIDPRYNVVHTGDIISVDVDVAGTGTMGLGVILELQ